MMKDFTISNMLDLNETIAAELFEGKTYPWEVLPEIGDFIIKLGKTLDPSEYEKKGENVWIAKSATVAPTASITGPAIIGREAGGTSLCLYPRQGHCWRRRSCGKLHRA